MTENKTQTDVNCEQGFAGTLKCTAILCGSGDRPGTEAYTARDIHWLSFGPIGASVTLLTFQYINLNDVATRRGQTRGFSDVVICF